ncbi:DUF4265 domain-containing protein [Pseudomonas sp. PSKL.D1]|uniref:DUF4265 domain-containing protein n=1 Tax=Pseudomonas sp. PSKL.D1 TaxID=3029060 RepID=UPI00238161A4|nr:DUF4265 domain-containing protein [Pseudomonas sp. PSKL.D1]WDY56741.1 DUF4265 domain-containing protein [Pseudomonas sp. PSKL.D1]
MPPEHPPAHQIVLWQLEQDAQGYPPASVEGLWVSYSERGYQVDSIPFYAYGIAPGDIISICNDDERVWFDSLLHNGGATVLRILAKAPDTLEQIREAMEDFSCNCEAQQATKMLAVQVPPGQPLDTLLYYLLTQRAAGTLDFEEGVLRHTIPEEFR